MLAVVTAGCTVSTTFTRLTEGIGVVLSRVPFANDLPPPLRNESRKLPSADPIKLDESGRLDRSTVNVNATVWPGAIDTMPLCGTIHETSEPRTPVSVAVPLLVKLTEPVGLVVPAAATSTRVVVASAVTRP